jgi:hypothetical protein
MPRLYPYKNNVSRRFLRERAQLRTQAGFFPRRGIPVIHALSRSRINQLLAGPIRRPRLFLVFGLNDLQKLFYFRAYLATYFPVTKPARLTLALTFFRGTFYISQAYSPPYLLL